MFNTGATFHKILATQEILKRLHKKVEEISEAEGYQEMAHGCDIAIEEVEKYLEELG